MHVALKPHSNHELHVRHRTYQKLTPMLRQPSSGSPGSECTAWCQPLGTKSESPGSMRHRSPLAPSYRGKRSRSGDDASTRPWFAVYPAVLSSPCLSPAMRCSSKTVS